MSVSVSASRILAAFIIAGIATLFWWLASDPLHWPAWVAMWIFGFILLALSLVINPRIN